LTLPILRPLIGRARRIAMLFRSFFLFLSIAWAVGCLGYGAYLLFRRSPESRHDRLISFVVLTLIAAAGAAIALALGTLVSEAWG
jgi:predicted membrane channel-forming protein YqfA (hemolysin III family)